MQKTLLLVDGSSYLYRAFHALPDMRNAEGAPTGALYGIINMLRRLRNDYPASYIACIFDAKGKTFRDDLYAEYKATRKSMPEDLALQIEPIHAAVRALGWPILMVEGIEADDVIGTLGLRAAEEGLKTIVSTGDKDMAQLVNDHVTLVNTMSNETMDRAGVIGKFGVPPERIVDYLSLIGDTVDNVPGVEKCGPKTAVKWLTQYDSLDGVIANADKITGVVGENLRKALPWLPQARVLVTIKTDCDLSAHMGTILDSLTVQPNDNDVLRELFTRYNFRTWLRELDAASASASGADAASKSTAASPATGSADAAGGPAQVGLFDASATIVKEYETVLTEAQLDAWIATINAATLTAVDTETTSLVPMQAQLVGISLCCEAGRAAYIPVAHNYQDMPAQLPRELVLAKLKPWLEDDSKPKLGQNLKYDSHIFANQGIQLRGIVHDTLLESYVFESHRTHDMDSLALRHLNRTTISYTDVCGKGASQICFDQVEIGRATEYAAEDADVTLALHQAMWPQVENDAKLRYIYEKIEVPTSVVLQKIERNGVLVDAAILATQSNELGKRMLEIEQQAYELAGQPFNLNSPKQLGEILFEKLQLPVVKKTPSGTPSTDEEVLAKLAEDYPLPKILLDYRGLSKLKSTYTDKLPKMVDPTTGRVHTNYAQAVAVTGRLASNDPNLQNIPIRTAEGRRIREAFIAPPGSTIVSADYSQIELRIMAHISGDANMLKAFADGEDIHRATASEIFGVGLGDVTSEQRRYAKVINFGLIYGMSAFGLAGNLGIERAAAAMYIDKYFQRFSSVKQYMDDTRLEAKSQGYVETVFGRRLWLPEINSPNGPRRQGAERAAINAPMQGTAADLIKLAMIAVQGWIEQDGLQSKLIMQVHDELVMEVPDAELALVREKLPELMKNVAELKVPLIAEVGTGKNWDQAH
ncbi:MULTISPECIES: DNA polymerase I [unclassified Herbaspirillum]|uniref:DNA polymerase I n=1 Tax=unclassified Herbaspirillum TaxID=2624150 RepID=UPI000E2FCDD7|nr:MULTISPECIES: DNA polymerase I [unclassified Herbaspirillum]RFB67160.1 DNA polymerase I [Herbaspirillum sp. 3R-3a1]TFI06200.1 DNA polymerase I [Herbaspirillum sp. 3R11]TFI14187.1 DNA polymerase I [Herbaspirillum sp. 3R-11]TFI19305.1 DNA polymerase I [Herbaspirillum sp. 3C11]